MRKLEQLDAERLQDCRRKSKPLTQPVRLGYDDGHDRDPDDDLSDSCRTNPDDLPGDQVRRANRAHEHFRDPIRLLLEHPAHHPLLAFDWLIGLGMGSAFPSQSVRWRSIRRRGPSAARNRGIEASRGEILALTDADCVATTQWLSELVRGFESFDTWGVAGEIVSFPPRTPDFGRNPCHRYSFVHWFL